MLSVTHKLKTETVSIVATLKIWTVYLKIRINVLCGNGVHFTDQHYVEFKCILIYFCSIGQQAIVFMLIDKEPVPGFESTCMENKRNRDLKSYSK